MGRPHKYISAAAKLLPEAKFSSLKALDRYRNLCLFLPIDIVTRDIPWGYIRHSENTNTAFADEKAIPVFKKAYEYLKNYSYDEVSAWMGTCGFPLSSAGLKHLVKERPLYKEISLSLDKRLEL